MAPDAPLAEPISTGDMMRMRHEFIFLSMPPFVRLRQTARGPLALSREKFHGQPQSSKDHNESARSALKWDKCAANRIRISLCRAAPLAFVP
jgi:hypothetical protein